MDSLERRSLLGHTPSTLTFSSSCSRRERHTCSNPTDAKRTGRTSIQSHLDNPERISRELPNHPRNDDCRLHLSAHNHPSSLRQTTHRNAQHTTDQHPPILRPGSILTPNDSHGSNRANSTQCTPKSLAWSRHVAFAGPLVRSRTHTKDHVRTYRQA